MQWSGRLALMRLTKYNRPIGQGVKMAKQEMKEKTDIQIQMDAAGDEAEKEIPNLKTAKDVSDWLQRWYMKAGYKRLNRALMAYFKNKK